MSHMITDFGIVHSGMCCSIAIIMYIVSTINLFSIFSTLISSHSHKVSAIILPAIFTNSILMIYSESAYIALSEVKLLSLQENGIVLFAYFILV